MEKINVQSIVEDKLNEVMNLEASEKLAEIITDDVIDSFDTLGVIDEDDADDTDWREAIGYGVTCYIDDNK